MGSPELSWRDLLVIVNHLPRTSALSRAIAGDEAEWSLSEYISAIQVDLLQNLVWLQSEDGAKNRNRPKPLPRPGIENPKDTTRIGSSSVDLDEMAAWLTKRNPHQPMN